jgi:hypothetical protein
MIFRKTGIHPSGQARGHAFSRSCSNITIKSATPSATACPNLAKGKAMIRSTGAAILFDQVREHDSRLPTVAPRIRLWCPRRRSRRPRYRLSRCKAVRGSNDSVGGKVAAKWEAPCYLVASCFATRSVAIAAKVQSLARARKDLRSSSVSVSSAHFVQSRANCRYSRDVIMAVSLR